MRIISIDIENVRGIKKLKFEPKGSNFLISGPNGSGKSGIVDAIDFLLTGKISRLTGSGTKDVSLKEHGPHIATDAKNARVKAIIKLDGVDKEIELERSLKTPSTLKFDKKYESQLAPALQAAGKGHYVLCRRELLKFINADGATRAQQIQELLNIPDVETTRKHLQKLESKYSESSKQANRSLLSSKETLQTICEIDPGDGAQVLKVLNAHRTKLSLPAVNDIEKCCDGLISADTEKGKENYSFAKQLAQKLKDATVGANPAVEADTILRTEAKKISDDPKTQKIHQQAQLTEIGLGALNQDEALAACPLCELPWEREKLKSLLEKKVATALAARALAEKINSNAKKVSDALRPIATLLKQLSDALSNENDLSAYKTRIDSWYQRVSTALDDVRDPVERFPFSYEHEALSTYLAEKDLSVTTEVVQKLEKLLPAESDASKSQVFLAKFLPLWKEYVTATQVAASAKSAADRASALHSAYIASRDEVLDQLYASVKDRFVQLYRYLNSDNENEFYAEIKPDVAAVVMKVDFFGKGLHPPNALHSEGHQDSMGLCLYLSLMEKLNENKVDVVVLDDVVMSVDADHRRLICELLSIMFKNKQFVITTHDRVWASHLSITGLIQRKNKLTFSGWDVDSGPHVADDVDVWTAIESNLNKNQVAEAATKLRRWGEEFFHNCCHELQAKVTYRADGRYDFGELVFPAIGKLRDSYSDAYKAAESWAQKEKMEEVKKVKDEFAESVARFSEENPVVNPNVHFNEWANFSATEFKPVVAAYKNLQKRFACATCGSVLRLMTEGKSPVALRCSCSQINFNLKKK